MDIGSRDLEQSLEFYRAIGACVVAFEPNPTQFEICKQKAIEGKIKVYPFALSNKTGPIDFYAVNENVGASSTLEPIDIPFASDKSYRKITVEGMRASDFINLSGLEAPDVVWMDVQGAELSVLEGFQSYLDSVKYIHCEGSLLPYYKGHQLQPQLISFLESKKFKHVDSYGHDGHPYNEGDLIFKNTRYEIL